MHKVLDVDLTTGQKELLRAFNEAYEMLNPELEGEHPNVTTERNNMLNGVRMERIRKWIGNQTILIDEEIDKIVYLAALENYNNTIDEKDYQIFSRISMIHFGITLAKTIERKKARSEEQAEKKD